MKNILIKSNKLNNNYPSGGQFYSAFSTISALFNKVNSGKYNNILLGVFYDNNDETNLKKYLQSNYYRDGNIIYPNSSVNRGSWDYMHLLTEDMCYKDFIKNKVLFHIRGIQDWVLHTDVNDKTKYNRHLFVKYYSRLCYRYLVPSTHLKEELVEYYKLNSQRIDVVPNGYDVVVFKPNSKSTSLSYIQNNYNVSRDIPIILHVSDLSYKKNIETLLKYFKILSAKIKVKLVIVGGRSKDIIDKYKMLARDSGVYNNIYFTGEKPQYDLHKFYNASEVFVYPSRSESFGKPALEAMACGCPAIVSKKTGAIDFMRGSELLVDPYDTEKMVKLSLNILNNKEYKDEQRKKAIKHSKKFTWDNTAKKLLDYYMSLP